MEYLPISEATKIYKISKTALTRLANKNINDKHIKKENKMFLVSVELLESKYKKRVSSPVKESEAQAEHVTEHVRTIDRTRANTSEPKKENENQNEKIGLELVNSLKSQNEFLQNQIIVKDVQLDKKDSQIENLLQRQFEQNSIIQTMQNRFEGLQNGIDNGVKMLSESVKENKPISLGRNESEKGNDNGFTIASAIMIMLLVLAIIVFLTVK